MKRSDPGASVTAADGGGLMSTLPEMSHVISHRCEMPFCCDAAVVLYVVLCRLCLLVSVSRLGLELLCVLWFGLAVVLFLHCWLVLRMALFLL